MQARRLNRIYKPGYSPEQAMEDLHDEMKQQAICDYHTSWLAVFYLIGLAALVIRLCL